MVSEVEKPSAKGEEETDLEQIEAERRPDGDDGAEPDDGVEAAEADADLPALPEGEGDAATGSAEDVSDYNEIVGATTKTVHEDITRFLDTFERSARRWEMVVYPAMFAFIILAGYGFFLIYSLTNNMNTIASSFDPKMAQHMSTLSENMQEMTENIAMMTDQVHNMSKEMKVISGQMDYLSAMKPISEQMAQMEYSMQRLSGNVEVIRYDMSMMNRNIHDISRPMNMIDKFVPW